ncbi:MAG: phosphodiester glycosidase family protein [Angelakisella sp.]
MPTLHHQPLYYHKKGYPLLRGIGRTAGRTVQVILLTLVAVLLLLTGAITIVCLGPSTAARDLFVVSALETSAAKFIPGLFLSQQTISGILDGNAVLQSDTVTDSTMVQPPPVDAPGFDLNAVTLEEVVGATYKGKMMIINDPSRLYVGTPAAFSKTAGGLRVEEMVKRDNALAGVNGGGFMDEGGVGTGGEPLGIVISDGVLKAGYLDGSYVVIGFDRQNKLVVGKMTAKQALDRGIRDAVSFSPGLIVNGEPMEVAGAGSGLNPRTAIGQRKDGSVLLLVIDGRQPHSLGASYADLIDVMQQYGAVNAANLDGGSSSLLVYENEIITRCASLYGSRKLPTSILVRRPGDATTPNAFTNTVVSAPLPPAYIAAASESAAAAAASSGSSTADSQEVPSS